MTAETVSEPNSSERLAGSVGIVSTEFAQLFDPPHHLILAGHLILETRVLKRNDRLHRKGGSHQAVIFVERVL